MLVTVEKDLFKVELTPDGSYQTHLQSVLEGLARTITLQHQKLEELEQKEKDAHAAQALMADRQIKMKEAMDEMQKSLQDAHTSRSAKQALEKLMHVNFDELVGLPSKVKDIDEAWTAGKDSIFQASAKVEQLVDRVENLEKGPTGNPAFGELPDKFSAMEQQLQECKQTTMRALDGHQKLEEDHARTKNNLGTLEKANLSFEEFTKDQLAMKVNSEDLDIGKFLDLPQRFGPIEAVAKELQESLKDLNLLNEEMDASQVAIKTLREDTDRLLGYVKDGGLEGDEVGGGGGGKMLVPGAGPKQRARLYRQDTSTVEGEEMEPMTPGGGKEIKELTKNVIEMKKKLEKLENSVEAVPKSVAQMTRMLEKATAGSDNLVDEAVKSVAYAMGELGGEAGDRLAGEGTVLGRLDGLDAALDEVKYSIQHERRSIEDYIHDCLKVKANTTELNALLAAMLGGGGTVKEDGSPGEGGKALDMLTVMDARLKDKADQDTVNTLLREIRKQMDSFVDSYATKSYLDTKTEDLLQALERVANLEKRTGVADAAIDNLKTKMSVAEEDVGTLKRNVASVQDEMFDMVTLDAIRPLEEFVTTLGYVPEGGGVVNDAARRRMQSREKKKMGATPADEAGLDPEQAEALRQPEEVEAAEKKKTVEVEQAATTGGNVNVNVNVASLAANGETPSEAHVRTGPNGEVIVEHHYHHHYGVGGDDAQEGADGSKPQSAVLSGRQNTGERDSLGSAPVTPDDSSLQMRLEVKVDRAELDKAISKFDAEIQYIKNQLTNKAFPLAPEGDDASGADGSKMMSNEVVNTLVHMQEEVSKFQMLQDSFAESQKALTDLSKKLDEKVDRQEMQADAEAKVLAVAADLGTDGKVSGNPELPDVGGKSNDIDEMDFTHPKVIAAMFQRQKGQMEAQSEVLKHMMKMIKDKAFQAAVTALQGEVEKLKANGAGGAGPLEDGVDGEEGNSTTHMGGGAVVDGMRRQIASLSKMVSSQRWQFTGLFAFHKGMITDLKALVDTALPEMQAALAQKADKQTGEQTVKVKEQEDKVEKVMAQMAAVQVSLNEANEQLKNTAHLSQDELKSIKLQMAQLRESMIIISGMRGTEPEDGSKPRHVEDYADPSELNELLKAANASKLSAKANATRVADLEAKEEESNIAIHSKFRKMERQLDDLMDDMLIKVSREEMVSQMSKALALHATAVQSGAVQGENSDRVMLTANAPNQRSRSPESMKCMSCNQLVDKSLVMQKAPISYHPNARLPKHRMLPADDPRANLGGYGQVKLKPVGLAHEGVLTPSEALKELPDGRSETAMGYHAPTSPKPRSPSSLTRQGPAREKLVPIRLPGDREVITGKGQKGAGGIDNMPIAGIERAVTDMIDMF